MFTDKELSCYNQVFDCMFFAHVNNSGTTTRPVLVFRFNVRGSHNLACKTFIINCANYIKIDDGSPLNTLLKN